MKRKILWVLLIFIFAIAIFITSTFILDKVALGRDKTVLESYSGQLGYLPNSYIDFSRDRVTGLAASIGGESDIISFLFSTTDSDVLLTKKVQSLLRNGFTLNPLYEFQNNIHPFIYAPFNDPRMSPLTTSKGAQTTTWVICDPQHRRVMIQYGVTTPQYPWLFHSQPIAPVRVVAVSLYRIELDDQNSCLGKG